MNDFLTRKLSFHESLDPSKYVYLDDKEYRDIQVLEKVERDAEVEYFPATIPWSEKNLQKYGEEFFFVPGLTTPSGFLENVKGSTISERQDSTNKWNDFNKRSLKVYRKADADFRYRLNTDIKSFYIKLSELSSGCPNLTLIKDVSVKKFEGRGVANKLYALLFYLAQFPDEVRIPELGDEPIRTQWLSDLVIEEVIETFLKDPNLKIEGRWFDIIELISVFGDRNSRMSHLKLKWDKRSFGEIKSRGKSIAHSLSINFFSTEPLKVLGRKRGHSESRNNNETRRTKTPKTRPIRTRFVPFEPIKNPTFFRIKRETFYLDYTDYEYNPDYAISEEGLKSREVVILRYQSRDINTIMLEISRRSKENYLNWLERYKVQLSLREKELMLQVQNLEAQIESFSAKVRNSK
jgi:hypothetical protein